MTRLTDNQRAMLRALDTRDWRPCDLTSGQSRTVNSLIERGLAEIDRRGGLRWVSITKAGRAATR